MAGGAGSGLRIRLLGPLHIERDGEVLPVPASRKARAILGYLILSPRPVPRQRLCDLFFDLPDDPRASLRWTLTKLRAVVDDANAKRILSVRDVLSFAPQGAWVDVLDLMRASPGQAPPDMAGPLLEDGELPERREFMAWLDSARDEVRVAGAARLRKMLAAPGLTPQQRLPLGRQLQTLEPLDEAARITVIGALAQIGRAEEAREALGEAERALRHAGRAPSPALRTALAARASAPAPTLASIAAPSAMAARPLIEMLPSLAVLPFQNYSPDVIGDDLMDGFLESVIHMLSRFKFFRVHSFGAALALKGWARDPHALKTRVSADYMIGGSIMAHATALKLRFRIVDAHSSALLASGDIDGPAFSAPAMLQELPEELTPHIAHQCIEIARSRADAVAEADRTPVEHYFHGMSCAYFTVRPDYRQALRAFQSALATHPNYAAAMGAAAHAKALLQLTRTEPVRSETAAQAKAAIVLGGDDAFALSMAAWSLVQTTQDVDPALRASDLAIRLNPLARIAWTVHAWIRAMIGEVETPLASWDKAEKCSAMGGSLDLIYAGRALCLWNGRRYEEAIAWAKRSLERIPNNPGALTAGLASAFRLGDHAMLQVLSARMLEHYPEGAESPVIAGVPFVKAETRATILADVRQGLAAATPARG